MSNRGTPVCAKCGNQPDPKLSFVTWWHNNVPYCSRACMDTAVASTQAVDLQEKTP